MNKNGKNLILIHNSKTIFPTLKHRYVMDNTKYNMSFF